MERRSSGGNKRLSTNLIMARNSQFGLPGSRFMSASFSSLSSACLCLLSSLFFFSLSTSFTTFERLFRPFSTWVCCCWDCSCCWCCCCCFCFAWVVAGTWLVAWVVAGIGGIFSSSRRAVNPVTESPCPFTVVVGGIMFVGRPDICRDNCLLEPAANDTLVPRPFDGNRTNYEREETAANDPLFARSFGKNLANRQRGELAANYTLFPRSFGGESSEVTARWNRHGLCIIREIFRWESSEPPAQWSRRKLCITREIFRWKSSKLQAR